MGALVTSFSKQLLLLQIRIAIGPETEIYIFTWSIQSQTKKQVQHVLIGDAHGIEFSADHIPTVTILPVHSLLDLLGHTDILQLVGRVGCVGLQHLQYIGSHLALHLAFDDERIEVLELVVMTHTQQSLLVSLYC